MKNLIKLFSISLLLALTFVSCEDDNKKSFQTLIGLNNQAPYVRFVADVNSFDSSKLSESSVTFTFSNTGAPVASYTLSVGKTDVDGFSPLGTYTSFPTTITYTVAEIASAMGLTLDDINPADFIIFSGESTGVDGTVVTSANLGGDLVGQPEQRNAYSFKMLVSCPPVDPVPGDWVLQLVDNYGDGYAGATVVVTIDDAETDYTLIDWWGPDSVGELYGPPNTGDSFIITVPPGTEYLNFSYEENGECCPGEVEITIFAPNGEIVGVNGPYPLVGEICIIP